MTFWDITFYDMTFQGRAFKDMTFQSMTLHVSKQRVVLSRSRVRGPMVDEFNIDSSGSSSRVRGAKKHEIYAAAFGGHLFYDLFLCPIHPPLGSATDREGLAALINMSQLTAWLGRHRRSEIKHVFVLNTITFIRRLSN